MTMSTQGTRSPRPSSMATHQFSSPRLPSPLNPAPSSHTPRNSPVSEMSDTLSPLRERLDSGLTISPRTSPSVARPRSSSFSRSPEQSPIIGTVLLQPHIAYVRHPCSGSGLFAPGIPFPSSSPRSPSPFTGSSQSTAPQNQRFFLPSNSPRPGSPASTHSTNSHFQIHPLSSPTQPTSTHVHLYQGSPIQIISSPSRYTRTQSLIQQPFGSSYVAQAAASLADSVRNRRVSLGAEALAHQSTQGNPMIIGRPPLQDAPATVKGDSTPLNEAPIRWWGGRSGWVDDWEILAQQSNGVYDAYDGQFDGRMGVGLVLPEYGSPPTFREPFGHGRDSPSAFQDEDIRASLVGAGSIDNGFAEPLTPGFIHAPMGIDATYRMDGVPVPVPVPMAPGGATARMRKDGLGYGEVEAGPPSANGNFATQKMSDGPSCRHSYHAHSHWNAGSGSPDGAMSWVHTEPRRRSRRLSDASTRSSTSYASCLSGPSNSQSQLLLASSSQSHTSTCPSLSSLGIGIEEAEREELRSRSIWRRKNPGGTVKRHNKASSNDTNEHNEDVIQGCRRSRLPHVDDLETECMGDIKAGEAVEHIGPNLKNLTMQARDKDTVKHGSMFSRIGLKNGDVSNEHAQREGYNIAEKYVSLAITSILPIATITSLSPFGEALIKARNSAKYVGHELAPLLKDTLSVSTEILSLAPLPGLEEAAKALLCVWDACQKVDTNRLSCLRLAERCATLLYSVRCEISEAGVETAVGLAEPVERLCGALVQIRTFLETQLHRPFLKRYVKREEIARELQACNEAITDAGSRFGISIQIRTYQEVCTAMKESKRWFAQEAQALIQLDHQMMQRHFAMMYGSQVQAWQEVGFSSGNALGLSMDGTLLSTNGRNGNMAEECDGDCGGRLALSPVYGPPLSSISKLMPTKLGSISGRTTPTSSILFNGYPSVGADSTVPVTPTPTRATFVMEEAKTKVTMTATPPHPTCPMQALVQVHRAQDAVDAAADEAALRGTLVGALNTQNDVAMVRCLQVARGEIPEAAETLRRMLGTEAEAGEDGNEHASSGGREPGMEIGHTELDRKFMQSGIEAMTRLTSVVAKQPEDAGGDVGLHEGTVVSASVLPSWTITRYEVIRRRKIGMGFFSDVYLGHWRKLDVIIKVLAHSISREAFVRHIELWNSLDHPNVLPLYGASSAVGEKPWFFVSKFCSGGNLVAWLRRMKLDGTTRNESRADLLKSMYEIAKGMAYLHGCGVLHGDLRAANVLVDEKGQCIISDFGQCEIKWEAHQSCGQAAPRPIRWRAPEMLTGDGQPTCATDVYAFAMCCIEILGMGDIPWKTLDDKTISELVLDMDGRPPIPVLAGHTETANTVKNLVHSCWDREPDRRPTSTSVASLLEELLRVQECSSPRIRRTSTPVVNIGSVPVTSTVSSPGDEQYETASESMMTEVEEERIDCLVDVPLASPGPVLGHADVVRSVIHIDPNDHTEVVKFSTQVLADVLERQDIATPMPSLTNTLGVDMRHEETYRHIVGLNHSFHSSLTLPLWSPTPIELGAVGYLSKPKGEFITLFNAMDPLRSGEEHLRRLPSMYGYGKFEVQKRDDGKRSVAQRSFDAISCFLTFKTRSDRSHPERIARQYAFPLVQGKPCAGLCAEKTVHRYMDRLEAPKTWFEHHADVILDVLAPLHAIKKEDLILVVGTLDASDWAMFVSDDHSDGRVQFSVFSGREKGEPWGMYTMERAVKGGTNGQTRWVDVSHTISASKASRVTPGGHDAIGDTVMLAGMRFEQGMHTPT